MNEYLKILLPVLVALVVASLAYRQWKKQPEKTLKAEYLKNKQLVYKELWEKLEDIHVRLRTEIMGKPEFRNSIIEINSYILRNQIFLEDTDQEQTNEYLKTIYELAKVIKASGYEEIEGTTSETLDNTPVSKKDAPHYEEIEEDWAQTARNMPITLTKEAGNLRKLTSDVEKKRALLIERFRRNMGS
jgi:hypothetical protein